MPKYPTFISELSEHNREHLAKCANMLRRSLRCCEGRLGSYIAGTDPHAGGSVFKLLQDLKSTLVMIDEMNNELIEKHGLPDELKNISKDFREDFKKLLLGRPTQ